MRTTRINCDFKPIYGYITRILIATHKMTLNAVSARTKLSRSHLQNLETGGIYKPRDKTLEKLAIEYGLELDFLHELNRFGQQIESHLAKQSDIENDDIDLLILRAIAYKILTQYINQANYPTDLLTTIKLDPTHQLEPDTDTPNLQRIIEILITTKFISISKAAESADTPSQTIHQIKNGHASVPEITKTKIADDYKIPQEFFSQLNQAEKALEEYFKNQTGITNKEKELLIFQTLLYILLEYYYNQAAEQYHYPKDLSPRHK